MSLTFAPLFVYSSDKKKDTLRKKSRRHQSESPDRKRDKSKKSRNDRNDRDKSLKRKETAYEERRRRQSVNRSRSVSPVVNDSQTVEYVTFESGASPRNSPYPQAGPDGQMIYRHRHPSSSNPDKVKQMLYTIHDKYFQLHGFICKIFFLIYKIKHRFTKTLIF